ncbi:hypothetical protein C1H46_005519 [Malus baccata]|uniref:Uncharacterized protein n=1 Tax=Malus baccata TaxID=106549 RepID=A0A540NCX7_MALBA|nr:hypothetical protein C1H46_005519 [Malus baccata]
MRVAASACFLQRTFNSNPMGSGVVTLLHLQSNFPVSPLPEEIISPLSTDAIIHDDKKQVGSFLMRWLGVVFKRDISKYIQLLGHWIVYQLLRNPNNFQQLELELSVESHLVFALLGFLIGLFLAAYSIIFGVEPTKGFRQLLEKNSICGASGILLREKFNSDSSKAHLWFGCIVGPLGVWIWWFLARLNEHGLGTMGCLKWVPFGTLIANISAACVMATQSTVKRVVSSCDMISVHIHSMI